MEPVDDLLLVGHAHARNTGMWHQGGGAGCCSDSGGKVEQLEPLTHGVDHVVLGQVRVARRRCHNDRGRAWGKGEFEGLQALADSIDHVVLGNVVNSSSRGDGELELLQTFADGLEDLVA